MVMEGAQTQEKVCNPAKMLTWYLLCARSRGPGVTGWLSPAQSGETGERRKGRGSEALSSPLFHFQLSSGE